MENKLTANKYGMAVGQPGEGGAFEADMQKLRAEADRARGAADVTNSEARIKKIEAQIAEATTGSKISSANSMAAIQEKEVTYKDLPNTLSRLNIPNAEAMAKWFDSVGAASPAAKAMMTISQWLKFILR